MKHPARPRRGPRRERVLPALGVLAAVLLLHAALLGALPAWVAGPAEGPAPAALRALQLRQLVLPAAVPATEPATAVAAAAPPREPADTPPSRRPRGAAEPRAQPPAEPIAETAAEPSAEPPAEPSPGAGSAALDGDSLAGTEAANALPAGTPVPTYATRLPPPATLQFTVQRGAGGWPRDEGLQAQLIWRPEDGRYTLSLGVGAVGSASVGAMDLHGLAPERHVETRRGRELRAANFQRQPAAEGGGRITFSGPRIEHPLLPGVQDRLSWMLQLAGVLAADPALGQPGRELALLVVGVRGDAALWQFRVAGVQRVLLPAGEVADAVHLQRAGARPGDTRVDVWLDPARHHLPVRLRLQHRAEGPATEFELLRLSF